MNHPTPARLRLSGPLAASLALHAVAVLLLVWLAPRERPGPPPHLPVTLRILPRPVASPIVNPQPGPPGPAAPAAPRRPAAPPAAEGPSPGGAAVPAGPVHAPGSDGWLAARGLERGDGPPVALPPAVGASSLPTAPAGPGSGPAGAGASPAGPVDPQAAIQSILSELQAAERVRTPHSYWSGVRARLEEGFSPGWEILETGPGTERGLVSGKAVGDAVRQYLAGAERYGRGGNPHGEGAGRGTSPAEAVRRSQSRLAEGSEGTLEEARPGNSLFHQELEVLVRVAQAADGRVERVELVQGSGNRAYDRLALGRARALGDEAAARLGPPPAQGRETVWAFCTSFDRVPPLPVVGLTFDAYFRPESFLYPLKTSARSRVELRSIR